MQIIKNLAQIAAVSMLFAASMANAMPTTFTDLGNIGPSGLFVFDTEGTTSNTTNNDTELGIWDSAGTLLASDDDSGSSLLSSLSINLADGMYFLGVSEFNSMFADNFINNGSGFESGEVYQIDLNINSVLAGEGVGTNALAQETLFFGVTVGAAAVPEPSTIALLGLSLLGLGMARRRRT